MDEEWTDLCTYSTHTQWSALCVLKWHKSFRTYDYSWGPTLCVTLSNIAAHISILTYFKASIGKEYWKSSCDIFHEPCFFPPLFRSHFCHGYFGQSCIRTFLWNTMERSYMRVGDFFFRDSTFHFYLLDMKWYKKGLGFKFSMKKMA